MARMGAIAAAGLLAAQISAGAAWALPMTPTSLGLSDGWGAPVATPSAATDDVWLERLTFAGAAFQADGIVAAHRVQVLSGRSRVNAEWGDRDGADDGNGTPFARIGAPGAAQETTDPALQDAALTAAFSGRNLLEMSDGEDRGGFSFQMIFSAGLRDDRPGVADDVPELVLFERGMNDVFDLELILGGTEEDPLLSPALRVSSKDFGGTGLRANTREIGRAQEIGAGGFDLDMFGVADDAIAYGLRLTAVKGGADLSGAFLTSADPTRFVPPLGTPLPGPRLTPGGGPEAAVPLPGALGLLAVGAAALGWAARRRRRA
ncbi:MAG: exosortase-dependent surface protein XDP2 [Pseudomonadota bacterium]